MLKKIGLIIIIIFLLLAIAYLYLRANSQKKYPVAYGLSFNRQYAAAIGLVWQDVYLKMLEELKPKYVRLAATWSETEPQAEKFNTADVDWQMAEAAKRNIKIVLVVGQKAPRWPECHIPEWTKKLNDEEYKIALLNYVKYIVEKLSMMGCMLII